MTDPQPEAPAPESVIDLGYLSLPAGLQQEIEAGLAERRGAETASALPVEAGPDDDPPGAASPAVAASRQRSRPVPGDGSGGSEEEGVPGGGYDVRGADFGHAGSPQDYWRREAQPVTVGEPALPVAAALDLSRDPPDYRETLGRLVRETWVAWANEQPDVAGRPSWTLPWEELADRDREVDMRIGHAVAVYALTENATTYGISCTSCARMLDRAKAADERAERAEAEVARLRGLIGDRWPLMPGAGQSGSEDGAGNGC